MTVAVRAELSGLEVTKPCCRRSELAAVLRFAGGVRVGDDAVVIQFEVDSGSLARRLRRTCHDLYGSACEVRVISVGEPRRAGWYVVQVVTGGAELARRTGLLDPRGRPVRGLPPQVVSGGVCDAEAVWRGAFLVCGALSESGRGAVVEVSCPGPEAALALVGAARRLGVAAKTRDLPGGQLVVVRGDDVAALLSRLGAHSSARDRQQHRMCHETQAPVTRLATFDDANLRRAAQAAALTTARVRRALQLLAGDAPEKLVAAARLRLEHPHASLEELGRLGRPPMTKDTVAGRIRRLLRLADTRAAQLGVPDTGSALTAQKPADM